MVDAITPLCARVFPDIAPSGTARPYVVFQQVGGQSLNPLDGSSPGLSRPRMQVMVWAGTRLQASDLMRDIEAVLRPSPINARPVSALISRYDETSQLRGAMQDFLIWAGD